MLHRGYLRAAGAAGVAGGVLGIVGNLLHPRYGDLRDVDIYSRIAGSDLYQVADVVIIAALLLTVAAFVAVARASSSGRGATLARLGSDAAIIGGAIAIASISLDMYALKQSAENFANAAAADRVGAFWATNAIDNINTGVFGAWTIVFLGVAPLLIGAAAMASRQRPSWVGPVGALRGALCLVVGFVSLSQRNQTPLQIPFLIGSLLVTAWIIAASAGLWRGVLPGDTGD
jgi:hypothetical protein